MDKFVAIATVPHVVAQIGLHPCLQPQTQAYPAPATRTLFAVYSKPHRSCDLGLESLNAKRSNSRSNQEPGPCFCVREAVSGSRIPSRYSIIRATKAGWGMSSIM